MSEMVAKRNPTTLTGILSRILIVYEIGGSGKAGKIGKLYSKSTISSKRGGEGGRERGRMRQVKARHLDERKHRPDGQKR